MSPPTEDRPPQRGTGDQETRRPSDVSVTTVAQRSDIPSQLRRRRAASYRCVPLENGHRDLLGALVAPAGPSSFGLTDVEIEREWARLTTAGWSHGEIARVLLDTLIDIRRPR